MEPAPGALLELTATGLSHDGRAVVPLAEGVAFVPGGLPGERLSLRLLHRSRRTWSGELLEVREPSPDRCRPGCILADRCGGCTTQHLCLPAQQSWKRQKVIDALQRIAHLHQAEQLVFPLVAAGDGYGYRNRTMLPLERRDDGSLRAGYYRPGSHRIVNLNHCPVLDPRLDHLVAPLKADLEASGWPVDRHLGCGGGLRHLGLRLGYHSGEVLITLVSSRSDLVALAQQAAAWMERWPQVVGVCLNIQDRADNVLLGPRTQTIAGRAWLRERFAGLELCIAADTFFQVNTPLAEAVVPLLLAGLEGLSPGQVVDAYCGIGTYSLPLARAGWAVDGIEVSAAALDLARRNAQANGLESGCNFHEGPVGTWLGQLLGRCKALMLDPPRKGLDAEALAAILDQPPERLLYLSCDPATLARDLARLAGVDGAYRLRRAHPIDFFPQTSHVEVLAVLERG